jgi:hypothetical protein
MKPLFIKWYPSQWLHSTARDEMNAAERATFHDFVCLAAISMTTGSFKFVSVEGLSRTLNTEASIIENTIKVCVEKRRISVSEDVEGSIIRILKWEAYQSLVPVNIKPKKRRIKVNVKTDSSLSDLNINIPSSSSLKENKINTEDKRLTQLLIELMEKNNPSSSILKRLTEDRQKKWMNECRLLREQDGRTPEEIESVIRFSQGDSFWKGNILSMGKLREKWDQLWIKARSANGDDRLDGIKAWAEKEGLNDK